MTTTQTTNFSSDRAIMYVDLSLIQINQKCVDFINKYTTITCLVDSDEDGTFWDGIRTVGNVIAVELDIAHPGDLLHEAGHLATIPMLSRWEISHDMDFMPELDRLVTETGIPYGCDHAATGWAFAACLSLGLDTIIPFETGYNQGDMLHSICQLSSANQFGNPLKQLGLHHDTIMWDMQYWDINLI